MKNTIAIALIGTLLVGAVQAQEKAEPKPEANQKASYCIGLDIANSFKKQNWNIDPEMLAAGIRDGYADKAKFTETEIRETLNQFYKEMTARRKVATPQQPTAEKNLEEGKSFLAENAKKEGIKVLPSGLQYKVLQSGGGKSPKPNDLVKTHYHGTLVDGTVFDSSVDRGQPVTFRVNQVIAGWTEALQLMKEGDKWQLFIPANLAYGDRQTGPKIGPNSTLIFEVELISVEPGK